MKPKLGNYVFVVAVIGVCCGLALAQSSPALRGFVPSRNAGGSTLASSGIAKGELGPTLSITWGIYTYPGTTGSLASAATKTGKIVGGYGINISANTPSNQGFLLKNNKFTSLGYPGALYTQPNGMSESGVVVGAWGTSDLSADEHGFKLTGKKFTTIDFPGATEGTVASGINKSGDIVGSWGDNTTAHGFLLSKGTYTSIDYPGAFYTVTWGIDSAGDIVGWYGANFDDSHGFIYSKGVFTPLDYPGYSQNYVADMNDSGMIVGGFGDDTIIGGVDYQWQHCYIYQNGQFTTFDAPFGPAAATLTWHLNNEGLVAGYYLDASATAYGFTATVGP